MRKTSLPTKILALVLTGYLTAPQLVWALPQGGVVTHGQASFDYNNNELNIHQGTDRAVINWQEFNIGSQQMAQFFQPGSGSAVLNRVVGGNMSDIQGALRANGNVFVVNPAGIVVGANAMIDVNGLVLSTKDVLDNEFMAGGDMNFFGGSNEAIVHAGQIEAVNGDVFLIAREIKIEETGRINAKSGTVGLAATSGDVLLKAAGQERLFINGGSALADGKTALDNAGVIEAVQTELKAYSGNPYALAIKNTGRVHAQSVQNKNGRILLTANGNTKIQGEMTARNADGSGGTINIKTVKNSAAESHQVVVDGKLDASSQTGAGGKVVIESDRIGLAANTVIDVSGKTGGGTALIGGDFQGKNSNDFDFNAQTVIVAQGAKILADSLDTGNAGTVIVWSDGTTIFGGTVMARGGVNGGDGGFVEISGKENLNMIGIVDTTAIQGKNGTLLLDPATISITNAANSPATLTNFLNDTDFDWLAAEGAGTFTLSTTYLEGLLNLNAVSLAATTAINIQSDLTGLNSLTLVSPTLNVAAGVSVVIVNGSFIASGAGVKTINGNITAGTNIEITGNSVAQGASSIFSAGSISITSLTTTVGLNGQSLATGDINIRSQTAMTQGAGGNIQAGGALNISSAANTVTLNSTNTGNGITLQGTAVSANATSTLNAGAGALNITSATTTVILSSTNITAGSMNVSANTAFTLNAGSTANVSGAVVLSSAGNMTLNGSVLGFTSFNATAGGTLGQGAASSLNGNGPIILNSTGNMTQAAGGNIQAGGALTITSTGGSITLNSTNTGNGITLQGTGIGANAASTLNAGTGALNVTSTTTTVALSSTNITAGSMNVFANTTFTLNPGSTANVSGAVVLDSLGAMTLNGSVLGFTSFNATAGTTLGQGTASSLNGNGPMNLSGGGNITLSGVITNTGSLSASSGATIAVNSNLVSNGGITLNASNNTFGANSVLNSGASDISVTSTGASMTVAGNMIGNHITLLSSNAIVQNINRTISAAGTLTMVASNGVITLNGTNLAQNANLSAAGNITQGGSGSVVLGSTLNATSTTGTIILNNAANSLPVIGNILANGNISLHSGTGTANVNVNGTVQSTTGGVNLSNTVGSITLNNDVNTAAGNINIVGVGINQTVGTTINAADRLINLNALGGNFNLAGILSTTSVSNNAVLLQNSASVINLSGLNLSVPNGGLTVSNVGGVSAPTALTMHGLFINTTGAVSFGAVNTVNFFGSTNSGGLTFSNSTDLAILGLNTTADGGNINIFANGTLSQSNLVYSGTGDIFLTATEDFIVFEGGQIGASNNGTIGISAGRDVILRSALPIISDNKNIQIGTTLNPIGRDILIYGQVNSLGGIVSVVSAHDIVVGKGAGYTGDQTGVRATPGGSQSGRLLSLTGAINVFAGNDLFILGGGTANNLAGIGRGASGTPITANISVSANSITMNANNGFAQIGHGGPSGTSTINADINVNVRNGGLTMISGNRVTADGNSLCYVQIGHGGNNFVGQLSGDVLVEINGNALIQGGTGSNAYASIGHGGLFTGVGNQGIEVSNSLIDVRVSGNLTLQTGVGADLGANFCYAAIGGIMNNFALPRRTVDQDINVIVGGNISMVSVAGGSGVAAIGNGAGNFAGQSQSAGNVTVVAGGNISMVNNSSSPLHSYIGTSSVSLNNSRGVTTVASGGTISMSGNTGRNRIFGGEGTFVTAENLTITTTAASTSSGISSGSNSVTSVQIANDIITSGQFSFIGGGGSQQARDNNGQSVLIHAGRNILLSTDIIAVGNNTITIEAGRTFADGERWTVGSDSVQTVGGSTLSNSVSLKFSDGTSVLTPGSGFNSSSTAQAGVGTAILFSIQNDTLDLQTELGNITFLAPVNLSNNLNLEMGQAGAFNLTTDGGNILIAGSGSTAGNVVAGFNSVTLGDNYVLESNGTGVSGNVTIFSGGNVQFNASSSIDTTEGNGTITVTAEDSIDMGFISSALSGGGTITFTAQNNILLSILNATGNGFIDVDSINGSILDNMAGGVINATAATARFQAGTGIGTSGNNVRTEVDFLSFNTDSGDVFIREENDVTVAGQANGNTEVSITTVNGSITLGQVLAETGIQAANYNVTLVAGGAGSEIINGQDVLSDVTATTLTMTADGGIGSNDALDTAVTVSISGVNGSTGDIRVGNTFVGANTQATTITFNNGNGATADDRDVFFRQFGGTSLLVNNVSANGDISILDVAGAANITYQAAVNAGRHFITAANNDININLAATIFANQNITIIVDEQTPTVNGGGWFRNLNNTDGVISAANNIAIYAASGPQAPANAINTPPNQVILGNLAAITTWDAAKPDGLEHKYATSYQAGGPFHGAGFGTAYTPGSGVYGSPVIWYKFILLFDNPIIPDVVFPSINFNIDNELDEILRPERDGSEDVEWIWRKKFHVRYSERYIQQMLSQQGLVFANGNRISMSGDLSGVYEPENYFLQRASFKSQYKAQRESASGIAQ